MGQLKWYKRDPRAALAGMMELSLEERGAYNTVLDLIYVNEGEIADDSEVIASWLKVDKRIWRRLRARLLSRGKLYTVGGKLRNERADIEVDAVQHRRLAASLAGTKSVFNRGYGLRVIKGLASGSVQRPLNDRSTNHNQIYNLKRTTEENEK